jgi:hypothetical protein
VASGTGNAGDAAFVARSMTAIFLGTALGTTLPCLYLWLTERPAPRRTA